MSVAIMLLHFEIFIRLEILTFWITVCARCKGQFICQSEDAVACDTGEIRGGPLMNEVTSVALLREGPIGTGRSHRELAKSQSHHSSYVYPNIVLSGFLI